MSDLNNLKLSIDNESVHIYYEDENTTEPIHIVYWHLDEVEEDTEVAIAMVKAVDLFYRNPSELLEKLKIEIQ